MDVLGYIKLQYCYNDVFYLEKNLFPYHDGQSQWILYYSSWPLILANKYIITPLYLSSGNFCSIKFNILTIWITSNSWQ